MKSIQSRIIFVISAIMIVVVAAFLFTSTIRTNAILDSDSQQILLSAADYYANIIDDNFRSAEQSVHTIYNYALKRTETYTRFLEDEEERDEYTYDISELGKSIAENTRGAMSVYLRYNPEDYGASNGLWYTINLKDGTWQPSVPTDMSLYDRDDVEHVGWYYIPVEAGVPMWMDPYYNANLGVDMISYIIPYYYGDYTVGIIGMDISMDLLKEAVSGLTVYKTGRAFLMTRNGDLIYHEDFPDGIGFNDLGEADQGYFNAVLHAEQNVAHVFPGRDGTQQKLILKELKNGMILGLYAPLSEINAPQRSLLGQQLLISAVILFFAIMFGLIWVRTITEPLNRMTSVAEQYASGDFNHEISVNSEDEVGVLSRSLQTMSTSLKQQIEIADSANKAKSDFLANMSHEIRTPINAVLGMNEMILRETTEENIREYSSDIRTAGRTLLSLINSILDFSRIEDGKMEILPVSYDTASFVNNLVNSISERAKAKNIGFAVEVDETIPVVLRGDDVRLTQIVMNLLTNAVKYTETGEVNLRIKDLGRHDDIITLMIEVEDTGIGIREEDIDKLAQSFTRIDEKRNRNIEGTGLGMAIVTKLLEMMDSRLDIRSVYDEGSVFSFRLSQQIIDSKPIGSYEERVRETHRTEVAGAYPKFIGAEVLVVDDYEMNLKVARNLLRIFGIEADLVSSGPEAIEKIRGKKYHVVLLDHMMPQMDGIETLRELERQGLRTEEMAVVALTANAVVGASEVYLSAGFDDYLTKPIDVELLGETLFRHLPENMVVFEQLSSSEGKLPDGTVMLEFEPKFREETDHDPDHDLKDALETCGIDVQEGLKYSAESMELYREILGDYAGCAKDRIAELEADLSSEDWEAYRIMIHSLKGASRTIGADRIAKLARALEDAAKEQNAEYIRLHHPEFISQYGKLTEDISDAFEGRV